jgi:hypothetical protein
MVLVLLTRVVWVHCRVLSWPETDFMTTSCAMSLINTYTLSCTWLMAVAVCMLHAVVWLLHILAVHARRP